MSDPAPSPAAAQAMPPVRRVVWPGARRIIRSRFPPIDLFDDIADPRDWALLNAGEQRSNPRLIGRDRDGARAGVSFLTAPFAHASPDRPSRFDVGRFGVLYVAERFETALFETVHHHARFMARTREPPGWSAQFRELSLRVDAALHDLRGGDPAFAPALDPDDWAPGQALGARLRHAGAQGVAYPSVRDPAGQCAGLFTPDGARDVVQGRHLDYHWNGVRVDFYRDASARTVFRIEA